MRLREKVAFKLVYGIRNAVQHTEGVKKVKVKVPGHNRDDELMEILKQASLMSRK